MNYKELVNNCPELGDIFAEVETRLLTLENSLPNIPSEPEQKPMPTEPVWDRGQWDYVLQIKAEVLHYRTEHANLMLKLDNLLSIKDRKGKAKPTKPYKGVDIEA